VVVSGCVSLRIYGRAAANPSNEVTYCSPEEKRRTQNGGKDSLNSDCSGARVDVRVSGAGRKETEDEQAEDQCRHHARKIHSVCKEQTSVRCNVIIARLDISFPQESILFLLSHFLGSQAVVNGRREGTSFVR
jgi:hypothetical protein